ncbi:MAG: hypothetical protein LBI82_03500 [Dysgonamonadaceae bacterium]|jgi:hypothetical protein|nr:hypothetical protein [Dysgonamonadaceae bacterium]
MSNKWKWVYNPFEKVAGWKAFGIGIVILSITTIVGYFGDTVFYGISVKVVPNITWILAISLQALGLAVTVAVMYIAALLFAKHVRFQDILGTVTLSKYPLILMSFLSLAFGRKLASIDIDKFINNEVTFSDYSLLLVFGVISIILLVWSITLLYQAFKISTNLKGVKCGVLFAVVMLISEIITYVLITVIY